MSEQVQKIPEGQAGVIAYLCVQGAANAIDFYKRALSATELFRMADSNGRITHAELKVGHGRIMLSDEFPERGVKSPRTYGGSPVGLHLYVENVDQVAGNMISAGAKATQAVSNMFYGDRSGEFEDPFGHKWWISTHVEDVSPDELARRAAKARG
jgi:PhnB protein